MPSILCINFFRHRSSPSQMELHGTAGQGKDNRVIRQIPFIAKMEEHSQIMMLLLSAGRAGEEQEFAFVADARKPTLGEPLNAHFQWYGDARSPSEVRASTCNLQSRALKNG